VIFKFSTIYFYLKKNKTGKNYVSKSPDFLHICN
jgi:hypothetical protein